MFGVGHGQRRKRLTGPSSNLYSCDMGIPRFSLVCVVSIFLLVGGLFGCGEGSRPEVPEGQFTAEVKGGVTDTIAGPAFYRLEAGELVGVELGERGQPGLSLELEPRPLSQRSYEVVEWNLLDAEREDMPPGVVAFLDVRDARFEATRGSLDVTYVGESEVGATFEFEMEGSFVEGSSPEASVHVSGSFRARERQ